MRCTSAGRTAGRDPRVQPNSPRREAESGRAGQTRTADDAPDYRMPVQARQTDEIRALGRIHVGGGGGRSRGRCRCDGHSESRRSHTAYQHRRIEQAICALSRIRFGERRRQAARRWPTTGPPTTDRGKEEWTERSARSAEFTSGRDTVRPRGRGGCDAHSGGGRLRARCRVPVRGGLSGAGRVRPGSRPPARGRRG